MKKKYHTKKFKKKTFYQKRFDANNFNCFLKVAIYFDQPSIDYIFTIIGYTNLQVVTLFGNYSTQILYESI